MSKLAYHRKKKDMTQDQLAARSGVTARTIQRIENGAVVPHVQTLKMLASCLDVEVAALTDAAEGREMEASESTTDLAPFLHLLGLVGLMMPILNVILPMSLWLMKRHELPVYDTQGKQVMNFQITLTLILIPSLILLVVYFPIGFLMIIGIYLYGVIMGLKNTFRASNRMPVGYPFSFSFFKTGGI